MSASKNHTPFLAFTIKHRGRVSRVVTDLWVSDAYDPANPPGTIPLSKKVIALWDTGASKSVISDKVIAELKLPVVGAAKVMTAGGECISSTHMVNFVLPNQVGVPGILVTNLIGQHDFDAIVGMDIITQGDLALTNHSGETWMSFRYPSIKPVDYVEESNKQRFAGVGRNSYCPCGAKHNNGRRKVFRECHGKK